MKFVENAYGFEHIYHKKSYCIPIDEKEDNNSITDDETVIELRDMEAEGNERNELQPPDEIGHETNENRYNLRKTPSRKGKGIVDESTKVKVVRNPCGAVWENRKHRIESNRSNRTCNV